MLILENVLALLFPPLDRTTKQVLGPSNATVCMRSLEAIGFCVHLFQLDPKVLFGLPVSRLRVYFLAIPSSRFTDVMTEAEYHNLLSGLLGRFAGHPQADLNDFLLPESSPPIQEYYAAVQAQVQLHRGNLDAAMVAQGGYHSSAQSQGGSSSKRGGVAVGSGNVPKWVDQHAALLEVANVQEVSAALTDMFPGLLDLNARELDILRLHKVGYPERQARTVELSQSILRCRAKEGTTACVVPDMRRWLSHRCRLMHGIEAMNLQCIRFGGGERLHRAHTFSSQTLQDLAGNAFNALCEAACDLALTTVLALVHARRHARQAGAAVPREPQSGDDSSEVEGFDELWSC